MKPRHTTLLFLLALAGCPDGGGQTEADAGVPDAAVVADQTADTPPPATGKALILDQQLGDRTAWIDVIDALEAAGYTVHHRRYYPHLTAADASAYRLVILAAGNAPAVPASTMRLGELKQAEALLDKGGALLLAPLSSWHDSYSGENDWFLFNRLLEQVGAPLRVDKNTLIGAAWTGTPSPPHVDTAWAYGPTLELALGFPYLKTTSGHPTADKGAVAGGSLPTLRVASDKVDVLLRTHDQGYIWRYLTGDPSLRVVALSKERAVAAVTRVKQGHVAVVPRATLTSLGGLAGSASDKPARDLDALAANRRFLAALLVYLRDLTTGKLAFKARNPLSSKDPLFTVAAPGIAALGQGSRLKVGATIDTTAVPAKPPAGDLLEPAPAAGAAAPPPPAWFGKGGARVGYGDLTSPRSAMTQAFGEALKHGLDALLTPTQAERLSSASPGSFWETVITDVAKQAATAKARWIAGGYINTLYAEAAPGTYPQMVGAQGQARDAPAPLDSKYWHDVMIPTYAAVGELAAKNPGLLGFSFDLELYKSQQLWHTDGYAFSDSSLAAYTKTAPGAAHKTALEQLAAAKRLDYLVQRGLLKGYLGALEAAAEALGQSCREAARKKAPKLELLVYLPVFPSSWFYRGLLRGLGTKAQPVIVLTFEAWAKRAMAELNAQGIFAAHIGGTLVSHWKPADMAEVLQSLARGSGGYWYLYFNDFSSTKTNPPALHGTSSAYWQAVDTANQALDGS